MTQFDDFRNFYHVHGLTCVDKVGCCDSVGVSVNVTNFLVLWDELTVVYSDILLCENKELSSM